MWITTNCGKFLKRGEYQTTLPGQEATVRPGRGTTHWFKIGKGVWKGCILSPCLFNLYVEHIVWNARLHESTLESRLLGEISATSDMQISPNIEADMATHSSILVWRIPWTEELGGLQESIGSQRVENDWSNLALMYHSNVRKRRVTKEPLDEGERGGWKSWLETGHSKN